MSLVESKVVSATGGAGAGAVVSSFIVWLLGVSVWHVSDAASKAGDAIAAVPTPVSGLVFIVISASAAFAAGWLTPHTATTQDHRGTALAEAKKTS